MIEEGHRHELCRRRELRGEAFVFRARHRISAWMVVHEDERGSAHAEPHTKRIARANRRAVEAAFRDASRSPNVTTSVDTDEP